MFEDYTKGMKIGVFDSGIGGMSVANAIKAAYPQHEVVFRNDAVHVPYGSKPMGQVLGYVVPILQGLIDDGIQCIVIACNTVSTNLIDTLRNLLPVPLIAMEPMVKPAAERTKTGVITVCATPATLASPRYHWLKDHYAKDVTVLEPDCPDWATMIETNSVDRQKIAATIESSLAQKSDVIVLGCTHYHWIEQDIRELAAGKATVLQPEQPVIEQLDRVLQQLSRP
jgi:glutamate racemase